MIKSKMVPDEAAKAALKYFDGYDMKEALAAALNAWPGVTRISQSGGGLSQEPVKDGCLILPLPAEASE